jgi:lysophospholipase L1-like esterase
VGVVQFQSREVEPFVRGAAWPAGSGVAYPRADPTDARLPRDTWVAAQLPAGVRLEFVGSATDIDVGYVTGTDELGYRGSGAGCTFDVWRGVRHIDAQPAVLGPGTVRLSLGGGDERVVVYLPEGMKPKVTSLTAIGGNIEPAAAQSSWLAYGDSITEGWSASSPARCWLATAGRELSMNTVNLGFAGSARGEIVLAQQIGKLDADVITVAYGTNCWSTIPHTEDMVRATTASFLRILRAAHQDVPILVVSPLIRPDAEDRPNALGTTLADIRNAIEHTVSAAGDCLTSLLPGADLLPASMLADGIHPGDDGHRVLATVLGAEVIRLRMRGEVLTDDSYRGP